jgi:hypothetical protein
MTFVSSLTSWPAAVAGSLTAVVARRRGPVLPRRLRLVLSVASVVVLLAVAAAYATVVTARVLGYRVVVTEHTGETTTARSLLFVRSLPLARARSGQVILVRDAYRDFATVEVERIRSLRRVHGAVVADTERTGGSSRRRLSILTRRVIVPAASVPEVGYFVGALTSPIGWLLALALPATGLALSLLRRIWLGSGRVFVRSPLRGMPPAPREADSSRVMRPHLGADPLEETS